MRRLAAVAVLGLVSSLASSQACANIIVEPTIIVTVDKSTQQMAVMVEGAKTYTWKVSTGRRGYGTPSGIFKPQWMARSWFSRQYYHAPMPHAIFFNGGVAIHGSTAISQLGGPASHGCVRLHPNNAATLFALVQTYGQDNTRIIVSSGMQAGSKKSHKPRRRQSANARMHAGRFAAIERGGAFWNRRAAPAFARSRPP